MFACTVTSVALWFVDATRPEQHVIVDKFNHPSTSKSFSTTHRTSTAVHIHTDALTEKNSKM